MAEQTAPRLSLLPLLLQHQQQQQQERRQRRRQNQHIAEHFMYKTRLQEYCKKERIPLPIYHTKYDGAPLEDPKFTSTVVVDGEIYTSPNPCSRKKAAEQGAAKLALETISEKTKSCVSKITTERGFPPNFQDKVFCKSILHEFAKKMNFEKPVYDTVKSDGITPVFISSLVFKGVKYVGEPGVNKKEAEQLAARAGISFIMANSTEGIYLLEMIKSKDKHFSAVHQDKHIPANADTNVSLLQPNPGIAIGPSAIKGDSEVSSQAVEIGNVDVLTLSEQSSIKEEGAYQARNGVGSVVSEVQGLSNAPPKHEFRKPVLETFSDAAPLPIAFVPSLQVDIPTNASAVGVKRKRKKKNKSNKKAKTEIQSEVRELPLSQGMSFTVAQ